MKLDEIRKNLQKDDEWIKKRVEEDYTEAAIYNCLGKKKSDLDSIRKLLSLVDQLREKLIEERAKLLEPIVKNAARNQIQTEIPEAF